LILWWISHYLDVLVLHMPVANSTRVIIWGNKEKTTRSKKTKAKTDDASSMI
jgi:hypothetical protein